MRRKRRFEIKLVDPTAPGYSFERDFFKDFHRRTLRPLLENVARCRVFQEPPDPRTEWVQNRIDAKLESEGARPADWRAAYIQRDGEEEYLLLTPEVLDDELFWWWALTQPSSTGMLFLVPLADFDWVRFFQRGYDPQQYGGSRPHILRDAKQETRRNGMVAFLISNSLTASVVASGPNVEQLFQMAVEHAVLTSKMVAPRSIPR